MAHVLITFLGKGDPKRGYQTARYVFPSGAVRETAAFGLALLQEFCEANGCVDRLVVLGTASSAWGSLLADRVDDELWVALDDASKLDGVDQALLDRAALEVAAALAQAGLCREARLGLIPFGRDEAEQVDILRSMASRVESGDRVSIDVTHGFRHLPMLGLVSALFLEGLHGAEVAGLYYGALEMRDAEGLAPVLRLDGLLRVVEWVRALDVYRYTGDYGVFAPLLLAEGVPDEATVQLEKAVFLEKTQNIGEAKSALAKFRSAFGALEPGAVLSLFAPELTAKTAWVQEPRLALRQVALARSALAHRNYLRACLLGLEALVTARCAAGQDPLDFRARERARRAMSEECAGIGGDEPIGERRLYYELNTLRNAVSHGTRPPKGNLFGLTALLGDEARLRRRLEEFLLLVEQHLRNSP